MYIVYAMRNLRQYRKLVENETKGKKCLSEITVQEASNLRKLDCFTLYVIEYLVSHNSFRRIRSTRRLQLIQTSTNKMNLPTLQLLNIIKYE